MKISIDALLILTPAVIAILAYLIRIERALAKLKTDVCWIKKELHQQ